MRRHKQQLSPEAAQAVLETSHTGILCTVDGKGIPYGVPVNYAWFDGAIWFHGARAGKKMDNLNTSPNVCFTVVGKSIIDQPAYSTEYVSVIVQGRAQASEDWEALRRFTRILCPGQCEADNEAEIAKDAGRVAFWKIVPEEITGKQNKKGSA